MLQKVSNGYYVIVQIKHEVRGLSPLSKHREKLKIRGEADYFFKNLKVKSRTFVPPISECSRRH